VSLGVPEPVQEEDHRQEDLREDADEQEQRSEGSALAEVVPVTRLVGRHERVLVCPSFGGFAMTTTPEHDARMAQMTFSSVYPHYVTKVEKKGRTKDELHQVIDWLTGFDEEQVQQMIDDEVTFEEFFARATLNPNASLIKGVICGYRVEEIEAPLTQQVRYLDKLVDELAKGKKMEKILRA